VSETEGLALSHAILSTAGFDARTEVDQDSLTSAPTGDEDSLAFCSPSPEDVNGDGWDDLVVKIEDTHATFTSGSGTATLTGELLDGTPFEDTDHICIVP
jgi:hypothetical protein